MTSVNLDLLLKGPFYNYSDNLGLQQMNWEGGTIQFITDRKGRKKNCTDDILTYIENLK